MNIFAPTEWVISAPFILCEWIFVGVVADDLPHHFMGRSGKK